MRFGYRYRKVIAQVTLAAFAVTSAAPASAVYNPQLGRFVQRDPHGTALVLAPTLHYHAANPTVTVSLGYELQFGDGANFYQFVRSSPANGRDPGGMSMFGDLLASTTLRASGYAAIGALGLGGYYSGRGALRGYVRGSSPREMASATWDEMYTGYSSYERLGGILILSAIAATGPVGLGVVAGTGMVFGGLGYADAQTRIAEAENFEDLYLGTYDGYAGVGVMGLSAVSLQAAITRVYRARFGAAASSDYRATFFQEHPHLRGKVIVHHAVEQQAMTRYPGAVSESEVNSLQNLRGIPKNANTELHLSAIRREWNGFYRAHPTATKQQLLEQATRIDAQYGHLFDPPVR